MRSSVTTKSESLLPAIGAANASSLGSAAFLGGVLLSLSLMASDAHAAKTSTWSTTSPHTSTASNGVVVTATTGTAFTSVVAGTMNTTNYWSDSFAASPTASIPGTSSFDFLVTPTATQTVTFTFSEAVDNPILHIERMGGSSAGLSNSSSWQLVGSNLGTLPSATRLAGNPQFQVSGNSFFRPNGVSAAIAGCSVASAAATTDDGSNACGSVRYTGSGITSLTFTVTFLGPMGLGDGMKLVWSIGGSKIGVAKQSVDGTRSFSFSGTNGMSSVTLNTATTNPIASTYIDVTDHRQAISITETSVSDYSLTGATCMDQSSSVVASTLSGQTLSIPATSYRANQNIICTFVNRRIPSADLFITKSNGVSSVNRGTSVSYDVVVKNNGPDAVTGAVVKDIPGAGINCPAANAVSISGSGVPSGTYTIANLTGTGITLGTIANGQSATLKFTCTVI